MILIADSGSTKTDWRLIAEDGQIHQATCAGINPYYHSSDKILDELLMVLRPQIKADVGQVYFYGAGCSSEENILKIRQVLSKVFPDGHIEVNHDLLAAARSLCGNEAGIACILGTGTNSCLYDGQTIVDNLPSLGYVMADEGSGAYLGKQLMNDYFRRNMPDTVKNLLDEEFGLSRDDVLRKVYQEDGGSGFLASFSKFILANVKEPYLYKLVYHGFEEFFEKNIIKYENYKDYPVHFTGSIAYYYSDILRRVATDKGLYLKNITHSPIAGLTLYHQKRLNK